jgi:hypothetical protein
VVHADDLALELDQHAPEGLGVGPALLGLQAGEARVGAQVRQEGADSVGGARQKQVDTLGRDQDRAHESQVLRAGAQVFTQHGAVVYAYEFVGRDIQDLLHGGRF